MKLYAWGANSYGQLGQGTANDECAIPTESDRSFLDCGLDEVIGITGGGGHSFIIDKSGRVYGCGWNNVGQIGSKNTNLFNFSLIDSLTPYVIRQISSKWDASFALTDLGVCLGWGANTFGQLGRPSSYMTMTRDPVELIQERGAQVVAGLRHCAILTIDGFVLTAGDSTKGQLGRPVFHSQEFRLVPGLSRVRQVACGQHQTFAITEDCKLFAWGCNKFGQLGLDPTLHQIVLAPLEVILPHGSIDCHTSVHSGWTHAALLTGNGRIINWGRNKYGQLGCPPYERPIQWKPREISPLKNVKDIHIGSEHNVAILDDGVLVSWGWNEHGSCGMDHYNDVLKPEFVKITSKAVLAGVGAGHSLAITSD